MTIFFKLLAMFFGVVSAVVTLSYAIAWYEYANREPQLLTGRLSPRRLLFAVILIVTETLCLALTILLQPLGWLNPKEKVSAEQQQPIILLHGLFQSPACWLWIKFQLRRRGFTALHTIALPPWKDVEVLTERLAKRVDELRHTTGLQKVHLIGHSMGGIIARNYLQIRGGALQVDHCLLIATPNNGSKLAPFALSPLGSLLMPGSKFLQRLAAAPLPVDARISSIYSRHDNMVLPYQYAHLDGARNIELAGNGHTRLLFHRRVVQHIVDLLQEERL
ncbi:MAG: alpha/beta fold hydrolase [Syntrophotaleaceae bacterium]